MDPYLTFLLMLLGWGFLFFSWYTGDKWATIYTGLSSMVFFFVAGGFFNYVTVPYQLISSTDTVITGEQHLAGYEPFGMLCMVFGFISLLWLFIYVFYEMIIPKLKEMGVS